jgi:hypothetical protein
MAGDETKPGRVVRPSGKKFFFAPDRAEKQLAFFIKSSKFPHIDVLKPIVSYLVIKRGETRSKERFFFP